jgi:signal transduction histidine kinase
VLGVDNRIVPRLVAPLAAVTTLLLVTAIGTAWYVRDMQRTSSELVGNYVASVRAAQELEVCVREVDAHFDRFLITGDPAPLGAVPQLERRTADALAEAERLALTPAEQTSMTRARRGFDTLFERYGRVLAEPRADDRRRQLLELSDDVLNKEVLEPAHEYLRLNEEMLAEAARQNDALAGRLTVGLVALGATGTAGGLLGGWLIAGVVRRSIRRTHTRLQEAADRLHLVAPVAGGPPVDPLDRVSASVAAVLGRLEQSERDALRAEQLARVGQMAAGIAHEVRNPLMAVKLLVQAAARPGRDGQFCPRDVEVLEEEIGRMENIVSTFLDFARPARPDRRPVELRPLADQVAAGVRPRADLQRVAVEVAGPAGPVVVDADPGQVKQVLYNLVYNALDAQPDGGRVTLAVADRPDGGAWVEVADDGPGLPAGLEAAIFDPFVSTRESGLGLGLSICRRIVEAHGGAIRAGTRPGGGAAFRVEFPAPPPAPAAR